MNLYQQIFRSVLSLYTCYWRDASHKAKQQWLRSAHCAAFSFEHPSSPSRHIAFADHLVQHHNLADL